MRKLLLSALLLAMALSANAVPVQELVQIPYPISYKDIGINAYAQNGEIVVGKDLAKYIDNEDQIGLIILHEAHHLALRHAERMSSKIMKFCENYPMNTQADMTNCMNMHKAIYPNVYQDMEREADLGAFLVAKEIGYSTRVCNLFLKIKAILGDSAGGAGTTHPSLDERYSTCLEVIGG